MNFTSYQPAFPLARYVHRLWFYQARTVACPAERIFTDGTVEVIINLGRSAVGVHKSGDVNQVTWFGHSLVCGPHTRSYSLVTPQPFTLMGVWFHPAGAAPFLPVPVGALLDEQLVGDALGDSRFVCLHEQLQAAGEGEVAAKFQLLEATLTGWLQRASLGSRHRLVSHALEALQQAPRAAKIAPIREALGVNHRPFVKAFREHVGLTPKLYSRIRRFQMALQRIDRASSTDWAGLALDCGYFDQAHFIHDFRAFAGCTPSHYLAARRQHLRRIPLALRPFFTISDPSLAVRLESGDVTREAP